MAKGQGDSAKAPAPGHPEQVSLDALARAAGSVADLGAARPEGRARLRDLPMGAFGIIKEAGPLPTMGFALALVVIIYFLVGTLGALFYAWLAAPTPLETLPPTAEAISAYKELRAQWNSHVMDVFRLVLKEIAFPVLMAILGYIFGARERLKRGSRG